MTLWRIDEHNSPARRSTNLIVAACPRGRSIRAAASMQVELVAAGTRPADCAPPWAYRDQVPPQDWQVER